MFIKKESISFYKSFFLCLLIYDTINKNGVDKMILIVEDDIAIQETLKELLCMKGYQVQQAYHMKEALLLDKSHIDVMIIDIQLPDGNGITYVNR